MFSRHFIWILKQPRAKRLRDLSKKFRHKQCVQMWGFILKVGIFRGKVGIDFFKWGLKFKVSFWHFDKKCKFVQNVIIFFVEISKTWGFFLKPWGFLKKSGDYFAKCGDFWGKIWWGQVGIFDSRDGDFDSKNTGNTVRRAQNNDEVTPKQRTIEKLSNSKKVIKFHK